ncbi:MAG: L-lactate permease [Candidatus Korobacteraceae bacterium]
MWQQHYFIHGLGLWGSALLAALPIFTLLLLLGVLRKPAWLAALCGLGVTMALAVFGYQMPVPTAVSAALYGAAFGLFPICWIVYSAIVLYRITVETGKFEIIKDSIGSLTSDSRLQALLIAFAFGAFLEGAAGFGTPVAVAAAMLTGLGFTPFYASAICLLANTSPVAFGSIGIPVVTLALVTGLPLNELSATVGKICAPLSLFVPSYMILVMSGRRAFRDVWPASVLCGAVFACVQFSVSNYIGPQLTDILSSLATLTALVVLLKVWKPAGGTPELLAMAAGHAAGSSGTAAYRAAAPAATSNRTAGEILWAWMPYGLLVVFVLLWGYRPIAAILNQVTVAIPWPGVHNMVERVPPAVANPAPYAAMYNLNWLAAAGTSCILAAILSAFLLGMKPGALLKIMGSVLRQLAYPILTVASVLALAFLMNYSGATVTLGLAFAATGAAFPFFSALLGWLAVFLTGSDTSANALFGGLQMVTAERLGLDPVLMASSNSSGGVMGKMISLQTIAVAAAATGMSTADQARLFRFTLKHSILLASVIGLIVLFYAYGI